MITVAALVLVLVGAGKQWIDQAGRVDPGRLPDAAEVAGDGDVVTVRIPGGQVNIRVKTAQRTLHDDDDKRYEAPSDGRLVEASWRHANNRELADPPRGLEPDKMPDPKVWVRSGEQRERLTGTSEGISNAEGGAFAFATRDPLVVEVEFAGRRQSIDVTSGRRTVGSFAALYRPSQEVSTLSGIRGERRGDVQWSSRLSLAHRRVPYLHDLGWAKSGREWLVLGRTEYDLYEFGTLDQDDEVAYYVADTKPTGSVRAKASRLERNSTATLRSDMGRVVYAPTGAVFDIPRGTCTSLTFTLKLQLKRSEGRSSTTRPLTVSRVEPVSGALEPAGAHR